MSNFTHDSWITHHDEPSHFTCTGWQRCIGCLKFQISFHKRATNYMALLREITYKDKASYASSPPCVDEFYSSALCESSPWANASLHEWFMWNDASEWIIHMTCVTWPIRTCDMTHSYVWHDSFERDMNHSYDMNHMNASFHEWFMWNDGWMIHVTRDSSMTHDCNWSRYLYEWNSFMRVLWMFAIVHSIVWAGND